MERYRLGDPLQPETNLGPVAQAETPGFLKGQVEDARVKGARILGKGTHGGVPSQGWFFPPTLVADASPATRVMKEESFGPLVAVASVASDEEAVKAINTSDFGLTGCLWTEDLERAERLAPQLEVGTVFMNRCDYLDPALPWSGVKDTGKGLSLSHLGFSQLTRVKSLHFRLKTR
jgi:acyl-CoA reductase-like NAD-dependent aldehyde dehydrogenase